ncbi:MAG: peptidylprolyl isomerase [Lentimicrobium sp.]|jgi:peptidyl-prolyl cis-trans isomerase SurA|nr:peptidylprolyl isomerase [Lentimicrobium sp.]MDD2528112.1 peptidylprolyl isomerase [Lentimicrobiaceae bacterium]MDD4596744.1 peptidylprolyl isomerase [Lentimicrobiaceae bacterium]MDY0024498.1 peptidylprolyl isomerase [Lentimicrobium sp.]
MQKIITLFISLLILFNHTGVQAQEQIIDEVVAVVGANYILQSDIEGQYLQSRAQGIITDARATRCQILEDMLFQKLLLNQAELDSITITPEQVEQTLDARFRYYIQQFGSQEKMEQFYKKSLLEIREEFRPLVKQQLMVEQVQQNLIQDVKITPSEVRSFYNDIPKDSIPLLETEYEVARILIKPVISKEEQDATRERLQSLRDRIVKGENFAALATLYSEDLGSAKKGGEVGFVGRGQLFPEYEAAAFGLNKGDVSEIIKTQAGYHIIQLIERRGQLINTRHILLRPKVSDADIAAASKKLDSIANLIRNGEMTFEEAALKFSDDPGKINDALMVNPITGTTSFTAGQLDQKIFFVIEKMKIGDISRPMQAEDDEQNKTLNIYMLKSRTEPHRANLKDDYSTIQQWALNKKQGDVVNKWISEKITSTYFRIGEAFHDCAFQHKWKIQ